MGTQAKQSSDRKLKKPGGARRDRTADLLHAMQALSQLSYGPNTRKLLYFKAKLNQISPNRYRKIKNRLHKDVERISGTWTCVSTKYFLKFSTCKYL